MKSLAVSRAVLSRKARDLTWAASSCSADERHAGGGNLHPQRCLRGRDRAIYLTAAWSQPPVRHPGGAGRLPRDAGARDRQIQSKLEQYRAWAAAIPDTRCTPRKDRTTVFSVEVQVTGQAMGHGRATVRGAVDGSHDALERLGPWSPVAWRFSTPVGAGEPTTAETRPCSRQWATARVRCALVRVGAAGRFLGHGQDPRRSWTWNVPVPGRRGGSPFTGGRAVLHWDEVTYSVVRPRGVGSGGSVGDTYRTIGQCLVAGLRRFGVEALERAALRPGAKLPAAARPALPLMARWEVMVQGRSWWAAPSAVPRAPSRTRPPLLGPEHERLPELLALATRAARDAARQQLRDSTRNGACTGRQADSPSWPGACRRVCWLLGVDRPDELTAAERARRGAAGPGVPEWIGEPAAAGRGGAGPCLRRRSWRCAICAPTSTRRTAWAEPWTGSFDLGQEQPWVWWRSGCGKSVTALSIMRLVPTPRPGGDGSGG